MPQFNTIDKAPIAGKRVVVRVDLNVPMKNGKVTDYTRIERLASTVKEIADKGGKLVLLSHFGRPKGPDPEQSLKPLVEPLSQALGRPVIFVKDCIGAEAEAVAAKLKPGEVALMENLRFHAGEEKNDAAFAKGLAALGDLYVDDAFSTSHRAHASIEAITHYLPAFAGRLMQAELEALGAALEKPDRPLAAVVGGSKVSTKLELLGNLSKKVDRLIIGGGMANTFLFAMGAPIGKSLCEKEMAATALEIMKTARAGGCEFVLPVDVVVAREVKPGAAHETVPVGQVPDDAMILDIGPASIKALEKLFGDCRTLVWNGPFGVFEVPPFDAGTNAVANIAAKLTHQGKLVSIAGGGDTVAALGHAGVSEAFSYISTAGGAFLEWLEGKELPGVKALEKAAEKVVA
ncbi:MAG TPA: phosphoglycerate kinase [Alphaproteobacteria bacterium]|nr:phosphoglycerate kinase [Alphaproteobacteria bacterium]